MEFCKQDEQWQAIAGDYRATFGMQCPHCAHQSKFEACPETGTVRRGPDETQYIMWVPYKCTYCVQPVLFRAVGQNKMLHQSRSSTFVPVSVEMIDPRGSTRPAPDPSVPEHWRKEYIESVDLLAISAKASAAMARRVLDGVLRERLQSTDKLYKLIEQAKKHLPNYVWGGLHDLREYGNFAAHPDKDYATGEIIDVEPHEAEACLDVLDTLFEFLYVAPARAKARKGELARKKASTMKPKQT